MKIGIVGTRGIPAAYGGFETFAQELAPRLISKEIEVIVYCDKNSYDKDNYKGVHLKFLSTTKSDNPLWYYYKSLKIALKEVDIVLVTGTAGSLFYFLNIFYRKKIITNTDGVESRRAKWSFFKKQIIKLTESLAVRFSTALVADSQGITKYLIKEYKALSPTKIHTIEYGAYVNNNLVESVLTKFELKDNGYYLIVSRLEPENNVDMIVKGYLNSNASKPLIIVGGILDSEYVKSLLKFSSSKVRFIGGIYNQEELSGLRYSCSAYLHGHSVGGTNPSLLEALGSSNVCICHDNIFNREVTNEEMMYFKNVDECSERILELENMSDQEIFNVKVKAINRIKDYYNWENISSKYIHLFKNC